MHRLRHTLLELSRSISLLSSLCIYLRHFHFHSFQLTFIHSTLTLYISSYKIFINIVRKHRLSTNSVLNIQGSQVYNPFSKPRQRRREGIHKREAIQQASILDSSLQHSVLILSEIQTRTSEHRAEVRLPEELPLQKVLLPFHSLHSKDLEEGHLHILWMLKTENMLSHLALLFFV